MLDLYVQSFAHQGQWPFQCCLVCGHTAGSLHSLVTHPIHEAELASLFSADGWTPDMYRGFQTHICEPAALAQTKVSPHIEAHGQFHVDCHVVPDEWQS